MKDQYKNENILIFGLGLNQGGVGSAKFFASREANVRITDLKDKKTLEPSIKQLAKFKNISYSLGEHKKEDIDWADLIIKNPAVRPDNKFMEYAMGKGKDVEGEMGIFLDYVKPDQIIGITGTKGKSTTSSLIYELLKKAGKEVILAGNIGKSVLEAIPLIKRDTLVILEISSFQLESFNQHKISPKWAVITNIYPDHLNYYVSMDEYIAAKKLIGSYQRSSYCLFINKNDPLTNNPEFLENLKGKIIFYSHSDLPKGFRPFLKGEHNKANMAAALALGKLFKINKDKILKTLSTFKGVPFRMEMVKKWRGIKIYNDTTATAPSAAIQSLKALGAKSGEEPNIILICGGMNKKMPYDNFAREIDEKAKAVYFIEGDVVDEIICKMHEKPLIEGRFNSFEELLLKLRKDLITNPYFKKEDIILFSPGATSFNLFQNEFDRGRKFNQAVSKIFKEGKK